MTEYTAITILTSFSFFIIGVFIYSQNKKNWLYQICFVFSICVSLWAAGYAITLYKGVGYGVAIIASRVSHAFGALIPITFFHFVISLLKKTDQHKAKVRAGYFISFTMFILSLTPLVVKDVETKLNLAYYPECGPLYPVYVCLYILFGLVFSHIEIIKALKLSHGVDRDRLIYFFISTGLGFIGGISLFLLIFNIPFPPFASVFICLYPFMMAYSILVHKFMDIEVLIKRTAVFAGLFSFVYGVFTIVTIIGQEFFRNSLHWNQWVAMIPTVLIITFVLRPLENFLTNATEKFLFQKKYDYKQLLKTFTNEVLTVLDLQQLTQQTVAGLMRILKLESACILMFDKDQKTYKMAAQAGVKEKEIILKEDDALITYLKATNLHILKDKDAENVDGDSQLKTEFKRLNAKLCLPLSLHENLLGVLCLGMKKSGEDYIQEDIDILNTLARTEAIAISNAQLFDELSKTQAEAAQREKMAVIGTLAAGINHEICNPLGIVRGQCEMFLLNQRDGLYKDKTRDELLGISADIMAKVIKETDRATGITKRLSSFAKPSKKNDLEEVAVEKEIDEVVGLVGHDLKLSNIEFQKDFPRDFPIILADRKQIQEVLFNIIRNAAQAMDKNQGKIAVTGFADTDSVIVRIADNGSGIPQDKINQIFNPFYTTKAPGKGTGLGLFIVKQVVEKNKGIISVESEAGVGTTFTLKFPSARKLMAA